MRLLIFFLGLIFSHSSMAAEPVKLVTTLQADTPTAKMHAQFIAELFHRINTPYQLASRPPRRAEIEFKKNLFDGDIGRSIEFANSYPSAIRVDPPFFSLPFYAITRGRVISQWSDLHGSKIAYLRGIIAVENQLHAYSQLNPTDSVSACLRMVKAQRVDACLLNAATPPNEEFSQAQPALMLSEFAHLNAHIWLAPSQDALAKKLAKGLIQMQKDGSLAHYHKLFLNPTQDQTN